MQISDLSRSQRLTLETVNSFFQNRRSEACIPETLAAYARPGFHLGLIQAGVQSCCDVGLLKWFGHTGDDSVLRLTPDGAELLLEMAGGDLASVQSQIPASNRFVSSDHNFAELDLAKNGLEVLADEIRKSNDFFVTDVDRLAVISSVKRTRAMLDDTKIRVAELWSATNSNSTLGWLAKESGKGGIQGLAQQIIAWLWKAFGLG